jgi:hypothetical protein
MAKWEMAPKVEGEKKKRHEEAPLVERPSKTKDVALSVLSGAGQGVADIGEAPGTAFTNMFLPPPIRDLAQVGMQKVRGMLPQWEPQSNTARYAGAATRGAVGSAPFGPMGVLSGATGGVGGEAGADLTGDSWWGRLLGSVVGGTAPNLPGIVGGLTSRRVRSATEGMTPGQWDAAQQAQQQAAQQGVKVTGPEAIGPLAPDLLAKQWMVEQHPKSAGVMGQFMNDRPAQVKSAVKGVLSQVGDRADDPALLGNQVKVAADTAIDRARQQGNARAGPLYQAAEQGRIPSSDWNTLTANPVIAEALKKVKGNPYYGITDEAEGSIRWLDAAKKFLDDEADAFSRKGKNYASGVAGGSAKDIRTTADLTSSDYAAARKLIEQNMRQNVEPKQLSATGDLAATSNPGTQFDRLKGPLSNPSVVQKTASDIKMSNPKAYAQLVREGLETEFDAAMKVQQTGGQQAGGARFVRQLRGTDQTRQNVEALVKQLPEGNTILAGYNKLLDTLELTGNRLPVGSRTAANQLQAEDLTSAGLIRDTISLSPGKWWDRIEQSMSAKKMAKLFTDPESVKKMRQMAVTNPGSAKARALAASILGINPTELEVSE